MMGFRGMAVVAGLALAGPAAAQDAVQAASGSAPDDARPWTLSISGGITAVQAQSDQPFAALGIARNFGNSWIRVETTYVGSGNAVGLTIPAQTWIGGFSAGSYVGNLGLEGHVSAGRRSFDASSFRNQANVPITVGRSGGLIGVGGSISYDIVVNDRLFVTPYAGVDYNQIDFVVALTGPGGRPISSQQQSSSGVIGSVGAALSHVFASQSGSAGLNATFNTASNIAAITQVGAGQRTGQRTPRFVDAPRTGGSWGEIGGTISFNAAPAIAIDFSVIRTISFPFGDTTSGIAGARLRF